MPWWVYAFISALAAAATAVLTKLGVEGVPSPWATAVRTSVVLVFAWGIVLATRALPGAGVVSARTLLFLGLSGAATGVSWLAYNHALQLAPASRVAPVDKLSLALTMVLAWLALGETVSWRVAAGAALMVVGALLTLTG